ncbi:MAG: hypothetical protein R3D57_19050 [Hyphomicrobiaceae bacterium]
MKKIIALTTLAFTLAAAGSAMAGGCRDNYSYDTYSGGYSTTYTPVYSGSYGY